METILKLTGHRKLVRPQQQSVVGDYEHLLLNYQSLIRFKDLKSEILQGFREIGNCLVLMHLMDNFIVLASNCRKFL